ncbi:MATH and LRR domain-containing protein PFE0570w-like protein [Cucumis melo var. makuwa]|uniref:Uncharacterized protein LOC103494053 n=2 Tax=Cucumis melo TaxID=3656 RepID=A0A1S3BWN5_CUCME|nr:uncharacterized protein LOC103494053 [Cucumis melo]XP_008453292.1 uncharacterized protein LOC103494053 [Cucumis melo]XP_050937020.1 uncharacterized protein LOC103494053 [Cucumis melo]XP_050937021.1 uncharacterized protein LOC103494053 [Cucumis melo]XP_050937022.1 uncharacterized protein LOC103494053 [Cucumis melo]XP_050937023.1 uncharacterized protein LOC103494053 [Cucumis melo]KAA0058001.1 MATH and LRR domain-containing protein PFE0570w-like protein [Cucumis melo var. makuwa]
MEMAVCDAKASLEKKRKRKQRRRGKTTRDDNKGCNPAEDNASVENNVSQESLNGMCLNMVPEMRQSQLEVNLLGEKNQEKHDDLQCGEATGISVLTPLNVEILKEDDETSTSPNVDFCLAEGKENSSVPKDPDGNGTNMVKRDDERTETMDHSAPSSHVESQRTRKKRRRRRKRKSVESPKKCLETNMEDENKVSLLIHSHEEETNNHPKKFVVEEVMNGVLLEESVDCTISKKTELVSANIEESSMVVAGPKKSKDFENVKMVKEDDGCLETKYSLAQSNNDDNPGKRKREVTIAKGRRGRKFADTFEESLNFYVKDTKKDAAFNCVNEEGATSMHEHSTTTKIVKDVMVEEVLVNCSVGAHTSDVKEREETIKKKVPHSLACDATNDNISATGLSKKKLLILDVNGLLVDFVPYFPDGYTPDFVISRKAVFKRPFCDEFLQFCFERFEVGIWSSRTWRNLDMLVRFLMRDSRRKLLFCWDQSHCTTTRFTTIENDRKPLVLKELKKIWENLEPYLPWKKGEFNESNTLLLDDSPYKALRNPPNTAVFPTSYRYKDSDDTSLGPGGDLRTYLEGVYAAENVQKYVEQNPFGQKPISESSPSWKFYRKIIESEQER